MTEKRYVVEHQVFSLQLQYPKSSCPPQASNISTQREGVAEDGEGRGRLQRMSKDGMAVPIGSSASVKKRSAVRSS